VDPRAGLDDVEKIKFLTLPGLELRPLGHPVHSQSLTNYAILALFRKTFRLTNFHLEVMSYFYAISKKLTSEFHPWISTETCRLLFSSYSGPENINISSKTVCHTT
jgi:hypothetical protein